METKVMIHCIKIFLCLLLKHSPREGMETKEAHMDKVALLHPFKTLTPRGDGNNKKADRNLSASFTFKTLTPRGDGNLSMQSPLDVCCH